MFTITRFLKFFLRIFLSVGVVWGLYFLRDNLWFRAYPLVICVMMWTAFSFSLLKKRQPLVERFATVIAKASHRVLTSAEKMYCYHLTIAWVIFMTIHLGVTIMTLFLSHTFWALYNGCLAYVLMGGMFVGEVIIRKWVKHGA